MIGAPRAEALLVGDREVDERALGLEPRTREALERDRHRRGEVEHVDRAAAPDLTVDQLAAERIALPPVGIHRHDVGVTHQQQRRRRRIAALDARDEALAPGKRLVPLEVEPGVAEVLREQVDTARLVTRLRRAVVHTRVANQMLQQIADFSSPCQSSPTRR